MIYTFNNTTAWWRHVASRLEFASATVLVSDLPDADVDFSAAFHGHMRDPTSGAAAVAALGAAVCNDVIARCRLLRVLDRGLALRMIGAMWRTIEDLLDQERPDLFLCFVVDRYILDLFDRALARRGVRYVGLAIGVLPDTFMFMTRGEHTPVREPTDAEVDAAVDALVRPEFVPSYVTSRRFDIGRFMAAYAHFTARWLVFELLRVLRGRPHDYRYLATRHIASGFRVRLRDWGVTRYFRNDWRKTLAATPIERRVFIALSVNPEAAIEYWLRDPAMIDFQTVLGRVADALGPAGFHLFVKDHPNQFGFRNIELFRSLAKHDAVSFLPYDVPGQWLVDQCGSTFTWTGTVGLQAAMAGRCAVVDTSAYYFVDGLFVDMAGASDIDRLPERIAAFSLPMPLAEARRALARHFLRSTVPGAYLSWKGFSASDPERVRSTETIVASLNRYLPALATMGRVG